MPYAEVNGINIYYEVHGEGYPVVLISGLGSQGQSWDTQVPIYSKDYRVIVFDNRGAGKTDKPESPYSTEQMADDTAALMEALSIEQAHIIGKSMGGMIAQWLAIKYPQMVSKLVMGCSSGSRDKVGNGILKMGREIASKAGLGAVWFMALHLGYTRDYVEKNIDRLEKASALIVDSEESLEGYIGQSMACEGHNTIEHLPKIKAPAFVMMGESDLITAPERTRELCRLIPGAELCVFSGVGHGFWRERQQEVDSLVLHFLDK